MEGKFSKRIIEQVEEELIIDATNLATSEIRNCLYEQLKHLSDRFSQKWFSFNGKFVSVHDKEDELDSLA